MTPAVTQRTLRYQDRQRRWVEIAQTDAPQTLVMFLHGSQQSGNVVRNFTARTFDALANESTTVIYPDGVDHHFNDMRKGFQESARTLGIDDVGFLSTVISSYHPTRVIGCGFSNGGQMLLRILFERPGLLGGVALFGSAMPTEDNLLSTPKNYTPTPILAVQGTADPIVPYNGGEASLSGANRGTVMSALDSAAYLAQLNNAADHAVSHPLEGVRVDSLSGRAPVELWSIQDLGHSVPSPKKLDPRIGPTTEIVVGADLVREFFDL